jgi:hypothetical protein
VRNFSNYDPFASNGKGVFSFQRKPTFFASIELKKLSMAYNGRDNIGFPLRNGAVEILSAFLLW